MPKAYGYIRVSHAEQDLNTLDTQRNAIRARLAAMQIQRPDLKMEDIFVDQGVSAYSKAFLERKGGVKLNGRVKRGDVIIFSRVDRAFRDLQDQVFMLKKWGDQGIEFCFCDAPGMDFNSAFGYLTLNFLGLIAEVESRRQSERVKQGIATKKKMGKAFGKTPVGHKRVSSQSLGFDVFIPDMEKEEIARLVHNFKSMGMGYDRISDEIEDFVAEKDGRTSRRGIRSRYEYSKLVLKRLHHWYLSTIAEPSSATA